MYKRWFFTLILLCIFAIVLSCLWMIAPTMLVPGSPTNTINNTNYYLLTDHGGFVTVIQVVQDATTEQAERSITTTNLCVNLLPEQQALRIKIGIRVADELAVQTMLESLQQNLLE